MNDAVDAAISRDRLDALALLHVLTGEFIGRRLGLEEGDAEATGLEDADDMLDDIGRLATALASGDVVSNEA